MTANGRTSGVLKLSKNVEGSFPLQLNAVVGLTRLKVNGSITDLAELAGVDVSFDMQGRNLDELYKFTGVVLPSTPPYKVRGKLVRQGNTWVASQMQGTLGSSDVSDPAGPARTPCRRNLILKSLICMNIFEVI